MNQDNPYAAPQEGQVANADTKQLQAVALLFAAARDKPPTISGTLLTWPGTPLLLLVGVFGTTILAFIAGSGESSITWHWPLGFAAMIFGALLRDFAIARRAKRVWPLQSQFIDWNKVDEFTR